MVEIIVMSGIACIFLWYRNSKVCKERLKIINIISELASSDIYSNKDWRWRYEEFDTISYATMLLTFWKPINSFYKSMKCIQP